MFMSALQPYAVAIIIGVIALQYVFALFCLFKLAYLDITKKQYVLWNLFILLVFFIGCITFLVYYNKVKADKTIPPFEPKPKDEKPDADGGGLNADVAANDAADIADDKSSDDIAEAGGTEKPEE